MALCACQHVELAQIRVTVADTEVGGVQLPKLPKLMVVTESTEENDFVAVTRTYFLGEPPPEQVVPQVAVVPAEHSQNTLLVAVTPVSAVEFCAVELMPVESLGYWMPYCAPSWAP